jgi:hypothetical protein
VTTNTNTNTDSAAYTRLLDDLLWMYSQNKTHAGGLDTAVDAMIVDYTADPDHYSDGSRVGGEYIPDYAPNVIAWGAFPPPHRRTAKTDTLPRTTTFDRNITVDALTELIIQQGAIKFVELADYWRPSVSISPVTRNSPARTSTNRTSEPAPR